MTKNLKSRIHGLLYGFAIGDALGLGTEFMSRKVVEKKYPDLLTDYSQIVRDAHRSQWQRGEWSNDTSYILALIDSLCECDGVDHIDYARRLSNLYKEKHDDFTIHLRWIFSQPDYEERPFEVARRVWRDMQYRQSPSDNMGRALIMGIWNENVRENTIQNCRLTHPRPHCEVSALVIAYMANSILWKDREIPYADMYELVKKNNEEILDYIDIAHDGELKDFDLGNMNQYWFVRKAMGAALWSLWHCSSPNEALIKIVNEGGDADTNASLAIGLLGLKYGVEAIDRKYIDNLIGADIIEDAANRLTALLEKHFLNDKTLD